MSYRALEALVLSSRWRRPIERILFGHPRHRSGSVWTHNPAELDDPNHPPVEIARPHLGMERLRRARIAYVDSFSITVGLRGLDRSEAERFIDGLRAVPVEQFPNPIESDGADGLSVIDRDNIVGAEIVAATTTSNSRPYG